MKLKFINSLILSKIIIYFNLLNLSYFLLKIYSDVICRVKNHKNKIVLPLFYFFKTR